MANRKPGIKVPMTDEERAELQDAATAAGLPLASWVRHVCFEHLVQQKRLSDLNVLMEIARAEVQREAMAS